MKTMMQILQLFSLSLSLGLSSYKRLEWRGLVTYSFWLEWMDIHFFLLEFQLGLFKNLNDAYYLCDSFWLLPDTKLYDPDPWY